jgi:hypothetical protein
MEDWPAASGASVAALGFDVDYAAVVEAMQIQIDLAREAKEIGPTS